MTALETTAAAEEAAKVRYDKRITASVAKFELEDPTECMRLRVVALRSMGWKVPPTSPLGVQIFDQRYHDECRAFKGWPTFREFYESQAGAS